MSEHLPEKAKHGGHRQGSGRKQKWSFSYMLKIGQACEEMHQAAKDLAFEERKTKLLYGNLTGLTEVWDEVAKIPVSERKSWQNSEEGDAHRDDVRNELISLNELEFGKKTTNAVFSVSNRPAKGTRERIIEEVASEFGLKPKQVDNIWQQYRRFEKSISIG